MLIILTFFESKKVLLINMIAALMMSAKLVTLSVLEIKIFWNYDYDVIISVHDVTNKNFIMWLNLNCICGHVTKVGNSDISMREVMVTSIL